MCTPRLSLALGAALMLAAGPATAAPAARNPHAEPAEAAPKLPRADVKPTAPRSAAVKAPTSATVAPGSVAPPPAWFTPTSVAGFAQVGGVLGDAVSVGATFMGPHHWPTAVALSTAGHSLGHVAAGEPLRGLQQGLLAWPIVMGTAGATFLAWGNLTLAYPGNSFLNNSLNMFLGTGVAAAAASGLYSGWMAHDAAEIAVRKAPPNAAPASMAAASPSLVGPATASGLSVLGGLAGDGAMLWMLSNGSHHLAPAVLCSTLGHAAGFAAVGEPTSGLQRGMLGLPLAAGVTSLATLSLNGLGAWGPTSGTFTVFNNGYNNVILAYGLGVATSALYATWLAAETSEIARKKAPATPSP